MPPAAPDRWRHPSVWGLYTGPGTSYMSVLGTEPANFRSLWTSILIQGGVTTSSPRFPIIVSLVSRETRGGFSHPVTMLGNQVTYVGKSYISRGAKASAVSALL